VKRVRSLSLALLVAASCRSGDGEAEQAVRGYLAAVTAAYRAGDIAPVDPLVGDEQGRRLLGLIGVKRDAGVVLDAKLLQLEFTRTAREGEGWVVETRERWYYADRSIANGRQVGDDSTDDYAMRYRFGRVNGRLILEELAFFGTPVVGRKTAPLPDDSRVLHGLPSPDPPPAHRSSR
jgi:hypothetical protein